MPARAQVPEDAFEDLRGRILAVTASTSRSSMPAIYGMVAAAEVERLKPLVGQSAQNDVDSLELAGAEMAQAAAELVAREREIIALRWAGGGGGQEGRAGGAGQGLSSGCMKWQHAAARGHLGQARDLRPACQPVKQ